MKISSTCHLRISSWHLEMFDCYLEIPRFFLEVFGYHVSHNFFVVILNKCLNVHLKVFLFIHRTNKSIAIVAQPNIFEFSYWYIVENDMDCLLNLISHHQVYRSFIFKFVSFLYFLTLQNYKINKIWTSLILSTLLILTHFWSFTFLKAFINSDSQLSQSWMI